MTTHVPPTAPLRPPGARPRAAGVQPRTAGARPRAAGARPRTPGAQPRTAGVQPRAAGAAARRVASLLLRSLLLAAALALLLVLGSAPGAAARPGAAAVEYDWPLGTGEVTRGFDDPAEPWLAGHRGVDLAGHEGAEVRAAADGVVAFAGSVAGKPVVSIDHADGIRTTYEPVLAGVARGDSVRRGDTIGTLAAGHGTGSDLHWGARRGQRDYLDPTLLIDPPVVIRLFPLLR